MSYDNLAEKRKDRHQESLALRYSASLDEVNRSVVEEVLVDSEIQKTALENERAIELIDAGKMKEAKAILDQSASQLEALPASEPAARKKIQESVKMNRGMGEKLMSSDKSVSRKALREQNFNTQKQK